MNELRDKLSKFVKLVVSWCTERKSLRNVQMQSTIKEPVDNPFDGWLTFKEAGQIVNRNHSTIRYWAETGKITSYPVGSSGLRLVHIDEVKEYSENHSYRLPPEKRGGLKKSE